MRAYIVADLGFGDGGKGLLTDYLARESGAGVVVRYNGGAQAGHNVVTPDGRHHTFTQFGSGSFIPGIRTYLSRFVTFHPAALLTEGYILQQKGIKDIFTRFHVSDQAIVITPFHQAANRIREIIRGSTRHGSCGVGVGETVEDARLHPGDCILAGDLNNPSLLQKKLQHIREWKRDQMISLHELHPPDPRFMSEFNIFDREGVIDEWIDSITPIGEFGLVVSDSILEKWLHETKTVIFEGAQGVLLDADIGFHPFTTWSRCTMENAFDLISEFAPNSSVHKIGVARCYAVRHGPGPLPTETDTFEQVVRDHNKFNEWQGVIRYGWFDSVLLNYALKVIGGVDAIMLTHVDILPRLEEWKYCSEYKDDCKDNRNTYLSLERLQNASFLLQEQREKLTQALFRVTPILENCGNEEKVVIKKMEFLLGRSIEMVSRGPSANTVQIRNPVPS